MEVDLAPVYGPVHGLPASLLVLQSKAVAALSLMQQSAGLNRERKQRVEAVQSAVRLVPAGVKRVVSARDLAVLTHYMDPTKRFNAFWSLMSRSEAGDANKGSMAYAMAIDIQLLEAFEPAWMSIEIEDDVLSAACSEWGAIRERLLARPDIKKHGLGLGAFMLWPRIVGRLADWPEMDAAQRACVCNAAFALSSIGWSSWFVEQVIALRPEAASELGHLVPALSPSSTREIGAQVGSVSDVDTVGQHSVDQQSAGVDFDALLHRLDSVVEELHREPTREAVSELSELASEFAGLSKTLPERAGHAMARFDARRMALIEHLREVAGRASFDWLEADLIEQIDSRWRAASMQEDALMDLDALTEDAASALERTECAAGDYLEAADQQTAAQRAVALAETTLKAATGFSERGVAKRHFNDALRSSIEADERQHLQQGRLLDAASPFCGPFEASGADHDGAERTEQPEDAQAAARAQVHPAPLMEAASSEKDGLIGQPRDVPGPETAKAAVDAPIRTLAPAREATSSKPEGAEMALNEPPEAGEISLPHLLADEELPSEVYSAAAGEICRPVWRNLSEGHSALAFHAAHWIEQVHDGVKVPPPDLLAAVALSDALVLPDGAVQHALAARFAALESDDYAVSAPRSWHTALNLLLVAATLRPMVLAPSTGAQAVAAYLHQDGHYSALYDMVQKIKGLSAKLMGFRIEPTALRKARGKAAIKTELQASQQEAEDWIRQQAPNYTIKFASATSVWKQMVRPGGEIDQLLAPVLHNRIEDAGVVKEALGRLSDLDHVTRLIHHIDRKVLKRLRGEDIHSGALDHLLRLIEEALRIPRQWLGLVELLGRHGDRLRELLEDVHGALKGNLDGIEAELLSVPARDDWGLVKAGQSQALAAVHGLLSLFESDDAVRDVEPSPTEVLGRSLLLVSGLPVSDTWAVEMGAPEALSLLASTDVGEGTALSALKQRLDRGDVLGAEMMTESGLVEPDSGLIRQARERWKLETKREITDCRRLVEVGSAYGYLQDADRGQIESELAKWEAQLEDLRRFDATRASIKQHRDQIEAVRDEKKAEVRLALGAIPLIDANKGAAEDIERALDDGDVTRAHELLHWLEQGKPTPTELNEVEGEGFTDFFPAALGKIEAWLQSNGRREDVERAIGEGALAAEGDAQLHDGARRDQVARMFGAWADMKGQQTADQGRLSTLFTGLGLTVHAFARMERVAGREVWHLEAGVVDDRNLCPLPTFGSFANGRYRVICVWGRPTEEEFLQWVGDASISRPAVVLYFGRQSERKWRELSRLAKIKRRSFIFLDETLLFHLFTVAGSRLAAWLDAALPFSYASPYDATAGLVPPEMFYGRSLELEAVFGLNGRCFIYGGRQLGKTALLKRAEQSFHRPKSGNFSKWIDLRAEGIGVSVAASEIWVTLHEKLRELGILDPKSIAPTPNKKQGVEVVIRGIRDFLAQDGDRRILLLLDETDRFFEQDGRADFEETRKIKQLMDDTQRRFKVVFAGLHNVLRMTERPNHPLAHFGEPIEIGPLREGVEVREAADLIRRPMAAAGFAFESKGLVIRILAQTNYYPSLIQLYCSHLLRHVLSQVPAKAKLGGPRYVVTDRDIEQVYSSEALRDEIRAKFRLTLQLDPKYEVLAYAMALGLLRGSYTQSEGQSWQFIRQTGALHWWAEGFRDTSELDFRVLLDEMVGLGVLRKLASGNYVLRNPNVLLLLGTQEEIQTVLNKEREPVVEFESATFHPPLRQKSNDPQKNVFTYQQLSRILQRSNEVSIVAGTEAAGIDNVYESLADYLGSGSAPVLFSNCNDANAFGRELQAALHDRPKDQVSVFVIPHTAPWTDRWLEEAKAKLKGLRSVNKFASVVFVADAKTLWRQLNDQEETIDSDMPWISLLHWGDGFLRHWLEEQQLQLDADDRARLASATGLWPRLITDVAGETREIRQLREKIEEAEKWPVDCTDALSHWQHLFGIDVSTPVEIIDILAQFNEPVTAADLVIMTEAQERVVDLSLRWGEVLGITRREGAGYWTVDPLFSAVLRNRSR